MSTKYGVDSIHVNVGDGECTIHLLVQLGPSPTARTIVKTVLVDSGPANATRNGKHILPDCFESVAKRYGCPSLQFDAIVLSSWNPDLYGGLFELLREDMVQSSAVAALPQDGSIDSFKASWLKYDASGAPLTTLYAPCAPPTHVAELRYDTDKKATFFLDPPPTAETKSRSIGGFCRLVYARNELLGRDLWTGNAPPVDFVASPVASPRELLEKNPPQNDMPAMYCILANGIGIGDTSPESQGKATLSLIVMWNTKTPRISYYGAGTMNPDAESDVLTWIMTPSTDAADEGVVITSMKIGQPVVDPVAAIRAVDIVRPENIVMFCGSRIGSPRKSP